MLIAHRIGIAVVTAVLAVGSGVGHADSPPKQGADSPDESLLEFLGSVDPSTDSTQPDDGSWLAYLAQVDIGKAAKTPQVPPAPQVPAQPKPASAADGGGKPGG